jgi:hypothetical protein
MHNTASLTSSCTLTVVIDINISNSMVQLQICSIDCQINDPESGYFENRKKDGSVALRWV